MILKFSLRLSVENKTKYRFNFKITKSKTMRKLFILVVLTCLGIQGFSQGKLNKISVNPIQLFGFNITNLEYERGFNEGKLGVSFFYGTTGRATRKIGGYTLFVAEQNVNVKGYTNSISQNSFWYGGQLSVVSARIYDLNNWDNQAYNIGTLGLTGKIGYQFILESFYLDFFGGLGYAITNDLFGDAVYSGDVEEVNLLLTYGIKMGIAF